MKPLTNESVARVLGYTHMEPCSGETACLWIIPKPMRKSEVEAASLPAFTTSLDSIVAEIEARGLWWEATGVNEKRAIGAVNKRGAGVGLTSGLCYQSAKTAPLALCHALLEFIKGEKP